MVKSHWVPVLYLKNFGISHKNYNKSFRSKKIYFFYKNQVRKDGINNIKIQMLSLNKICTEDKFYSNYMEKYLNIKVETNVLNDAFGKLISKKSLSILNNDHKLSLQIFILTQLLRNPANIRRKLEMIKWLKTLPNEIYRKSIQNYRDYIPQEKLPSTSKEYQKMLENNIFLVSKFPGLLKNFKMQIWINKTNFQFYTSDNPVIDKSNFMFWNNKIFELNTEYSFSTPRLILPINPKILILFGKFPNIRNNDLQSKKIINNFGVILKINNEIIRNAEHIILMKSKNLNHLRYAIKINQKCLEKKYYNFTVKKIKKENINLITLVEGEEKKEYVCKYCGKKYRSKIKLQEHLNKYCKIKNKD
ncbi:MAG: DUF4238 domain-containing protein [Promethearchaeota archaeon]